MRRGCTRRRARGALPRRRHRSCGWNWDAWPQCRRQLQVQVFDGWFPWVPSWSPGVCERRHRLADRRLRRRCRRTCRWLLACARTLGAARLSKWWRRLDPEHWWRSSNCWHLRCEDVLDRPLGGWWLRGCRACRHLCQRWRWTRRRAEHGRWRRLLEGRRAGGRSNFGFCAQRGPRRKAEDRRRRLPGGCSVACRRRRSGCLRLSASRIP